MKTLTLIHVHPASDHAKSQSKIQAIDPRTQIHDRVTEKTRAELAVRSWK